MNEKIASLFIEIKKILKTVLTSWILMSIGISKDLSELTNAISHLTFKNFKSCNFVQTIFMRFLDAKDPDSYISVDIKIWLYKTDKASLIFTGNSKLIFGLIDVFVSTNLKTGCQINHLNFLEI